MKENTATGDTLTRSFEKWYNRYYKFLLIIPIILALFSMGYIYYVYQTTGDFIYKDITLTGGTSITVLRDLPADVQITLENSLQGQGITLRKLTDIRTGRVSSFTIETRASPEEIKPQLEKILGYTLDETNSSIEFTGSSLSSDFYQQLIIALIISFILMSIVVFFLFRSFIPSVTVIFAALTDILMSVALVDFIGMRLSSAGIAAFLMLVGYSVDTNILLTSRALRRREVPVNQRIYSAFKTGMIMTLTAFIAIAPIFFITSGIPYSFRQIFFILSIGLASDVLSTWLTNASLIKWYCEKKNI